MTKKILIAILFSFVLVFTTQNVASAQHSLGVSYENRGEDPTNGFGFQLESSLFSLPLIDLRLRGHFSYFSEDNEITREGLTYDEEIEAYDFGVAGIGSVSLGLIDPYVGVGLGSESWSASRDEVTGIEGPDLDIDDSSFYYYGVGGLSFSLLPAIEPYIELRYSGFSDFDREEIFDSDRRLLLGVAFRF